MRQLTVAIAVCGSAFDACPPSASSRHTSFASCRRRRLRQSHRRRGFVLRVRGESPHGLAERTWRCGAGGLEVAERPVVRHHRKPICLHGLHHIGQLVYRVVRARRRAVPARVAHRELERSPRSSRRRRSSGTAAAVLAEQAAAVVAVECVLGIDERAMRRREGLVVTMPVSSSPVNAMIRSRVGLKPSFCRRRNVAVRARRPACCRSCRGR